MQQSKSLLKAALRYVGFQVRRLPKLTPSRVAPELPAHLLSECRVLPSREALLAVLPKNGVTAEIGVADGDFSAQILKINTPRTLYLVDPWPEGRYGSGFDKVRARFVQEIVSGAVKIERGLSTEVLPKLPPLDWLYIDTDHTYTTTREELRLSEALIKPNGFIAGHDFVPGNPYKGYPYGVVQAVCEFCVERNWSFAYLTLAPRGHLSFCLKRP